MKSRIPLIPNVRGLSFGKWTMRTAYFLVTVFVTVPLLALFAPWQQHVSGSGRVIAFTPLDRPQDIEAPVKGRVVEVHVTEAQYVNEGDPLVQLVDIDPDKIPRIQAKIEATHKDLEFSKMQADSLKSRVTILQQARDLVISAFRAKADAAKESLRSSREKLRGFEAERDFARDKEKRIARLTPEFAAEIDHLEAKAKLRKCNALVEVGKADVDRAIAAERNALAELGKERESANASIAGARAKEQGERAKIAALSAKLADLEGELREQKSQLVKAPRAGRVFRLSVNTGSSIVKQGQVLLQIVPRTSRPAVELYVRGVDAPLIEEGRKVRLQFEGWPAVQFVGWPAVAIGTFGGVVKLVDPTDSGRGRFRVVILPDPDDTNDWPSSRWLRQGVRTKGWILLNEVSLGYEIWRQLNGFPPVVGLSEPEKKNDSKDKNAQ